MSQDHTPAHKKGQPGEDTPGDTGERNKLLLPAAAMLLLLIAVGVFFTLIDDGAAEPTAAVPRPAPAGAATIAVESTLLESAQGGGAPLAVGDVAPNFSYTLPDGTTQRLSDLRGQKVLVNFWATWCPPCIAEMPDLQAARELYGEEHGFVVLAVNAAEDRPQIESFADEMGLTIPLIVDPESNIGDAYGARNLPTSFFINSDGTVHLRHTGVVDTEFIQQHLEEMQ